MKKTQQINILVATDRLAAGGLETHLETIFKYLKQNFPINIFFYSKVENSETFRRISKFIDDFIEKKSTNILESTEEIKDILSHNFIDVLHLHPFSTIISGFIAGVEKNTPVSITLHGKASWNSLSNLERLFFFSTILPNSLVFSVNNSIMRGVNYLPNPIDLNFWRKESSENGNYILIVSRLDRDKTYGIRKFLNRIKQLQLPIFISGDGEEKEKLEREFPWVNFTGFSYGAKLKQLMQNALIVCGMGRVVLESLALGKPTALLNYNGEVSFIDNKIFLKAKESNFNGSNIEDDPLFENKISLLLKKKLEISFNQDLLKEFSADRVVSYYCEIITDFIQNFKGYDKPVKASTAIFRSFINEKHKRLLLEEEQTKIYLRIQEQKNEISQLNTRISSYEVEISNLNKRLKEIEAENKNLKDINNKLKEKFKQKMKTEKYLLNKIGNLEHQIRALEQEKKDLIEKNSYLAKENEYLSTSLSNITNSRSWKLVKKYYGLKITVNKIKEKLMKPKKEPLNKKTSKTRKYIESQKEQIFFVFPPTINWNIPLYQRPHHFADRLSKRNYGFIFCTTSANADGISEAELIAPNLLLTENWNEVFSSIGENGILILPSTNVSITIEHLYKLKEKGWKIIYDYIDEITDLIASGSEFQLKRHLKLNSEIIDLALSVSLKLHREMQEKFSESKTLYLPNACDYNHFHIKRSETSTPESIKKIVKSGKPIVGYYGALAKWIDYELISYLAEKRPEYQILLIGPDYDGSLKSLRSLPNLYVHPPVNYKVLPKYAVWFDIAIIPFIEGEIAESTSPIKLFEYMALGKPTVCTSSLKECSLYKTPLIAYDKEDFINKVDKALELASDNEFINLIDKEAKQNTWDARVDKLLKKLKLPKVKNET